MTSLAAPTERVGYLRPPETLPIVYVSAEEFRREAKAAGWDDESIRFFALPPYTVNCRALVRRRVLKIVPFCDSRQPSNPLL